jgi:hypothetical protein
MIVTETYRHLAIKVIVHVQQPVIGQIGGIVVFDFIDPDRSIPHSKNEVILAEKSN